MKCTLQEAEAIIQSAVAGRGLERMVEIDPPTMKQSVAWELAMRAIHIREVRAVTLQLFYLGLAIVEVKSDVF